MLNGKSILITGGTGSFGHRYVSTLLKEYNLKRIVIFSRDELKQYDMEMKFREGKLYDCQKIRFFIGDVLGACIVILFMSITFTSLRANKLYSPLK